MRMQSYTQVTSAPLQLQPQPQLQAFPQQPPHSKMVFQRNASGTGYKRPLSLQRTASINNATASAAAAAIAAFEASATALATVAAAPGAPYPSLASATSGVCTSKDLQGISHSLPSALAPPPLRLLSGGCQRPSQELLIPPHTSQDLDLVPSPSNSPPRLHVLSPSLSARAHTGYLGAGGGRRSSGDAKGGGRGPPGHVGEGPVGGRRSSGEAIGGGRGPLGHLQRTGSGRSSAGLMVPLIWKLAGAPTSSTTSSSQQPMPDENPAGNGPEECWHGVYWCEVGCEVGYRLGSGSDMWVIKQLNNVRRVGSD